MDGKVLKFSKTKERLLTLADRYADGGDFVGSLGFLFSALEKEPDNYEILSEIADTYGDMGLYEYSNRFWFRYIDTAPKEKVSVAYEELGINYFYLDNLWAAGYYFHLKVTTDGFITRDGLDQDIIDFLSESFPQKSLYKIVYPEEHADYSADIKKAKAALVSGNYIIAAKMYKEIPLSKMDEDSCGDAQTAFFLSEKDDDAIEACKFSIKEHGPNVTAYCNLSTVYKMKQDDEKSKYYYSLALSCKKGAPTEYYKIATCAIEQGDDKTAEECFAFILTERPYDVNLRFFYGLTLINLGKYKEAFKNFNESLRISPDDVFIKYYLKFADKLDMGDIESSKLLPLKYVKEFPEKVTKAYRKKLKEVADNPEKAKLFVRNKNNREILKYGIVSTDIKTAKYSAYILATSNSPFSVSLLLDSLLNTETPFEIKRYIIYALILSGRKESFGAVGGSIYEKIRPRKLISEDKINGIMFLSAYAQAMSRLAFVGINNTDKIAFNINAVYKKLGECAEISAFSPEEIAAVAVINCEYKGLQDDAVLKIFGVKKERINLLLALYTGVKND